jgi:hypothetical protein
MPFEQWPCQNIGTETHTWMCVQHPDGKWVVAYSYDHLPIRPPASLPEIESVLASLCDAD